jgi:hypothetical protein
MQIIKIKLILLLLNIIRPLRRILKDLDYKLIDLVD